MDKFNENKPLNLINHEFVFENEFVTSWFLNEK